MTHKNSNAYKLKKIELDILHKSHLKVLDSYYSMVRHPEYQIFITSTHRLLDSLRSLPLTSSCPEEIAEHKEGEYYNECEYYHEETLVYTLSEMGNKEYSNKRITYFLEEVELYVEETVIQHKFLADFLLSDGTATAKALETSMSHIYYKEGMAYLSKIGVTHQINTEQQQLVIVEDDFLSVNE